MRSLAVIPVATGVLRADLLQVRQEREEPFRAFAARVRGKAETCEFEAACECGKSVDYTDNQVRDVLLNGINDPDIRREVLGTKNTLRDVAYKNREISLFSGGSEKIKVLQFLSYFHPQIVFTRHGHRQNFRVIG